MESVYNIPLMSKRLIVACKTHKFSAAETLITKHFRRKVFFYQVFVHTLTAGGVQVLKLFTDWKQTEEEESAAQKDAQLTFFPIEWWRWMFWWSLGTKKSSAFMAWNTAAASADVVLCVITVLRRIIFDEASKGQSANIVCCGGLANIS